METFCQRYGWTPQEFKNTDYKIIELFSGILRAENKRAKIDSKNGK